MIKYMDLDGRRQITQIGFFNRNSASASYLGVFLALSQGKLPVCRSSNAACLAPDVDPYTDVTTAGCTKGKQHVGDKYGVLQSQV